MASQTAGNFGLSEPVFGLYKPKQASELSTDACLYDEDQIVKF
jgi:hypothetical protein